MEKLKDDGVYSHVLITGDEVNTRAEEIGDALFKSGVAGGPVSCLALILLGVRLGRIKGGLPRSIIERFVQAQLTIDAPTDERSEAESFLAEMGPEGFKRV